MIADDDPYNAVRSTARPKGEVAAVNEKAESAATDNGMPDPAKPILKAQPVEHAEATPATEKPVEIRRAQPVERTNATPAAEKPVEIRRAQPVHPMDEVPDDAILKPAPPPQPLDLGGNP